MLHPGDPRWPVGAWSSVVERPLARPTRIPVQPGVQDDQSPRGQVERARARRPATLRLSDAIVIAGSMHFVLCLRLFLAVSFPFYGGWLDFVFLSPTSGEASQVTAVITSGFPK